MPTKATDLLKNKFLRTIILSGLFSQCGIWIRNFSILLFVMDRTNGNPFAISMISLAEYVPIFVFSIIGGTLADRWMPKRTVVWCDILSAASVFAVLAALVLATWKAVFFTTFVSAILSQFSQPSGMKLFKAHVPSEQMQTGMSILQTMFSAFSILGPVLGTIAYQKMGIYFSIALVGFMFIASASVLAFLPADKCMESKKAPSTFQRELCGGLKYLFSRRVLAILGICLAILGFSVGIIQPLGVFIVTERLGLPKEALQWLVAVYGAGEILGGIVMIGMASKFSPHKLLAFGLICNSAGILVFGLSTRLWSTLTAQLIIALTQPCIFIGNSTLIMKNTEESFIGRVNGITTPLMTGAMVIAMSISGLLKQYIPLTAIYEIASLLFLIGFLVIIPLLGVPQENSMETDS